MILILSRDKNETTTEHVMEWLETMGAKYFRLNSEDLEFPNKFKFSNEKMMNAKVGNPAPFDTLSITDVFKSNNVFKVDINEIDTVWYRRWIYFKQYYYQNIKEVSTSHRLQFEVGDYLQREIKAINQGFFSSLVNALWLSTPEECQRSKFEVLGFAQSCGIDVPQSEIVSTRDDLLNFFNKHQEIITKNASGAPLTLRLEKSDLIAFTRPIERKKIDQLPEVFFPSLVQKLIDKEFEIRIFFLEDKLYPMAIFSQNNENTKYDFRNYDHINPNRTIPYKLPKELEEKIKTLILKLGMITGSVDMIKGKDGRWYFLEINPVGQFGMVSSPCNYYLEKKVAEYLVRNEKRRKKTRSDYSSP